MRPQPPLPLRPSGQHPNPPKHRRPKCRRRSCSKDAPPATEKSALNQSAVIGEWDSKRIADAIYGYQDGTYGGAMKTLMQNQVKGLTHTEVEALSEYIANLYVKTH